MKPEREGGRHAPFWENYRPHLVPSSKENWLGVTAVNLPEEDAVFPATSRVVDFDLVYHPQVDYSDLQTGSAFDIREGSRVVGTGTVIEWIEGENKSK